MCRAALVAPLLSGTPAVELRADGLAKATAAGTTSDGTLGSTQALAALLWAVRASPRSRAPEPAS